MRAVMLGLPGAGKGTQAERLAGHFGIPHISTGAIFRQAVQQGTPLGRRAKAYMEQGALVPDEVTVGIVRERIESEDCRRGFVLDGFPRNLEQARRLDAALERNGQGLDAAVHLVVPEEVAVRRITSRRVCTGCGATYGAGEPRGEDGSVVGVCPQCGQSLAQRADDSEDVLRQRLLVYETNTKPLLDYYGERGIRVDVDGDGSVDAVFGRIVEGLRARGIQAGAVGRAEQGTPL